MTAEDLTSLRGIEVADVLKAGHLAATLQRTSAGVAFAYTDDYLLIGGPAVATSLPLSAEVRVSAAGSVPPFFAGLLPEGRRLTALRDAVKTSLDDELSLVLAIGGDTVGDVRVVPHGERPPPPPPSITWQAGDEIRFADILKLSGLLDRRGMAGAQEKASVAMIKVPATAAGQEAILKLTPPDYPHLVDNEAWFLGLARKAGFTVPAFQVVTDGAGERGLLVARFDRRIIDGLTTCYAVEDAAQVMGIYPADKYRVTSEQIATALIERCQARQVVAREIMRSLLFAWLTGNGDLHAKNVSIINFGAEWRMAPAYDLPSSLPYGDETMALTLTGRTTDLSRKAFMEFADSISLPELAAKRAIDEMLIATEPALEVFTKNVEAFTGPRNEAARAQLEYRRRLLRP